MRFTDLFVKRPVLAIVVSLVIFIAGLQSIRSLSVRQYPRSDIAVVRVSTVYVGANADLVRGFITTPLERVIASADGIDYMESSSAQGLSTITVHLKLNYDTNAALTQIQAKVAQVRNDLPPEAEAPVIELETADNQFAAMYLGFSSANLDQNQITDYLTRVVQPKLSAISGVQRADILGDRTFAMRIWLKPDKMAALRHLALRGARGPGAQQLPVGARADKGLHGLGESDREHRSAHARGVSSARRQGGARRRRPARARSPMSCSAPKTTSQDVRFNGETATFMGVWVLPTANSLDVIRRVREAMPEIEAQLPVGMKVGIPYDSTEYIQDAIDEVLTTLTETLLIVIVVIFLFLGSFRAVIIPVVAIPISLVGAVFLMLVAGFTINLLTLLAIVLSVGLVVDDAIVMVENVERHLHSGKSPLDGCTPRSPGTGRADHRDDNYPGCRVRPGRNSGWSHGRAVPRIRVHAGGCGHRVRRRCSHPVADDGRQAPALGRHRARLCRLDQPPFRRDPQRLHTGALRNASLPSRRPRPVGHRRRPDGAFLHVLAARARAQRRSGRGVRRPPGVREFDP